MRKSFTRLGKKSQIEAAVKDARSVGARITRTDGIVIKAQAEDGAEVFTAVQVRPGLWAITYSTEFYADPDPH